MEEGDIKKEHDWFKTVLDLMPDGVCVTDLTGQVMLANRSAGEMTGYGLDGLIGNNVSLFYSTDDGRRTDIEDLRNGEPVREEVEFRRQDGSTLPVQLTYKLVRHLDGIGEALVEIYEDLTERRELDQVRNEFVFVAAHELRNPVTAMKLLLDMFLDDRRFEVGPIASDYVTKMQEATERLIQLVDDLLEVARTESGRLKIELQAVDPREIVETILAETSSMAESCQVKLVHEPGGNCPKVRSDADKLKEIVSNLVSNAVKYNRVGGTVTVSHEVDGGFLVIHVADTGIGIGPEDLKRAFTKFWRSEETAVRAQAGTGLGLFIVKELVERMGGRIWLESERGKGTTFSFSMPLFDGPEK
ncbi:MAG: ATP-binding protein [bacterium]